MGAVVGWPRACRASRGERCECAGLWWDFEFLASRSFSLFEVRPYLKGPVFEAWYDIVSCALVGFAEYRNKKKYFTFYTALYSIGSHHKSTYTKRRWQEDAKPCAATGDRRRNGARTLRETLDGRLELHPQQKNV
jgi:hypothetical protein